MTPLTRIGSPRKSGWLASFTCLSICLLLAACRNRSSQNLEENIASQIERCAAAGSCSIKVADFTPFDWDKAYIFYRATKGEREALLGVADPAYQDDSRQLVFLRNHSVVFYENESSDFEAAAKHEVLFSDDVERKPPLYDTFSHNAEFRVKDRRVGKNGSYYVLEQIH